MDAVARCASFTSTSTFNVKLIVPSPNFLSSPCPMRIHHRYTEFSLVPSTISPHHTQHQVGKQFHDPGTVWKSNWTSWSWELDPWQDESHRGARVSGLFAAGE
jgi:hypothetical protein